MKEMVKNLILLLLIVGVIVLAYFLAKKTVPQIAKPTAPAPSPLIDLQKERGGATAIAFYKTGLAKDKPYKGQGFEIEYLQSAATYFVTIQAKTAQEFRQIKSGAEQVFKNSGIGDLCKVNVFFAIPLEIKDEVAGEALPSGCQ